MSKKTIAALLALGFVLSLYPALLSISPVSAQVGGQLQPYVVRVRRTTMSGWNMEPSTYLGIPCTKITANSMIISQMYQSGFELTASSFSGDNMTIYANYVSISGGLISWSGDQTPTLFFYWDPVQQKFVYVPLKEMLGDPVTLENIVMHVLALEASNVVIDNYLSVTFPVEITQTASSVTMSGYDIVGTRYQSTPVTKITARSLGAKGMSMSVGTYRLQAPDLSMQNATIYATYVRGTALGLMTLSWSGSSVPSLVKLAKIIMPTMTMTNVTMRAVYIQANRVTIPQLSQSIL